MATIIGGVAITINAVSKGFSKGLDVVRAKLGKFIAGIGNAAKAMARYGAVMAAVAVGAMVLFIKRSLSVLDSLAKVSRQLDISAESLNTFRLAAKLGGTDVAVMEKALLRLNKNVSDANVGLTTAVRAFDALGLSSRELAGMNTDDQFEAIAKAMKGVESQSDKVRIALDLFGRAGAPILNVMEQDLDAVRKRVIELGGSFTALELKRVEEANDAIAEMKFGMQRVSNEAAIALAPAFELIADRVSQWIANTEDAGPKILSVVAAVANGIGWVITAVERIILGWKRFMTVSTQGTGLVLKGFREIAKGAQWVASLIGVDLGAATIQWLDNLVNMNAAVVAAMKVDNAAFASGVGVIANEIAIVMAEAQEALAAAGQGTDGAKDKMKDYTGAIDEAAKRFAKLQSVAARVLESIKTPQEKIAEETVLLFELWHNGLITLDQWGKAMDLMRKKWEDIAKAANTATKAIQAPGLAGAEVAGSAAAVRGTLERGNVGLNDLVTQGRLQFMTLKEIEQEQRRQSRWLQRLADGTVIAGLN